MPRLKVLYLITLLCVNLMAQERDVSLKILETSDVHGHFYPYNFLLQKDTPGSLSRISSLVKLRRQTYKDRLLLFDNGDIIQGQPTVYYYNFIDTTSTHLCAGMMNYLGYDVGNMGNHDVEAGRPVFERWIADCHFPMLGANIIDTSTGKPYLRPYEIIERQGVKIAVLGLITPAIPAWVPENQWRGLHFDDMEKTARRWMRIIRKKENPDIVIGLFHAGQYATVVGGRYKDNASLEVARRVPGFDVVMIGHDHILECKKIANRRGDTLLVVNPANDGAAVAEIDISLKYLDGKLVRKRINGAITATSQFKPDPDFLEHFRPQYKNLTDFLSMPIGEFEKALTTRDAYFGPSAFVDFIHYIQLQHTGADISFAAPLAFDAEIKAGTVTVNDMFTLYKFENLLYTMRLSGEEIKNYLEESYSKWTNRMKSPKDHLLLLNDEKKRKYNALKNFSYNFDSAAGITYTVDVTKKKGKKIRITGMADGSPFDPAKEYVVVINSYRGNGGGELLTRGAKIPLDKIKERIITSTDKDIRYYLIQYVSEKKRLNPLPMNQWKFIPEEWAKGAAQRDYRVLFPEAGE